MLRDACDYGLMPASIGWRPARLCAAALAPALFALSLTLLPASAAADPPLPPRRPADLTAAPPPPAPTPQPPPAAPAPPQAQPTASPAPQSAGACLARLKAAGVMAEAASPPAAQAGCGIADPVRLTAITLASGKPLDLPGGPLLDCGFALVFADFARNAAAPLAQAMLGSPLVSLATGPGYQCRSRNRVAGAKISAHARGIAIDVVGFTLADKRHFTVAHQDDATETLYFNTQRKAGCGWFTTILGPGADAAHADNLHLDIERHGSSDKYRICE